MATPLHAPNIDPVLIHLWGPFQIRWYSLLFVGGFIVGRSILRRLAREERFQFTEDHMEQFILWLLIGAVVGARIVYCFVYDPKSLFENPFYLFQVYNGGLSFHGGLIGLMVAALVFAKRIGCPYWNLTDAMCLAGPIGLAMGRLGNFINSELWGRVSNVPWAMVFPNGGPQPRHPSQLYELFLEGILLMAVIWWLKPRLKRDGQLSAVFLIGYSLARFFVEFFREPDAHIGYLALGLSMGQWLSLLMFAGSALAGYWFFFRKPAPATKRKKR